MEERRNAIVELVNREGTVTFSRIKQEFPDVSEMTLRTDLKALDQDRRLVRIHGGARSVEFVVGSDGMLNVRSSQHADAKRAIAQRHASWCAPTPRSSSTREAP